MSRTVTLVLVDGEGALLGALPPFTIDDPRWQEVRDVVLTAEERYGVSLQILRLLASEHDFPPGGAVSYLAEAVEAPAGLEPIDPSIVELHEQDQPLRAAYARPGGPARSLSWARTVVGPGAAVQERTWSRSAIWQLGGARRRYWLKQLPAFHSSEPAALTWLGQAVPDVAPRLLGIGPEGCALLADVTGPDQYDITGPDRVLVAAQTYRFQCAAVPAVGRLLDEGIADRRGPALTAWIRAELAGWADQHPVAELLADLDQRMADVAGCGVPNTLVHGQADPAGLRVSDDRLVFLDWSDCFIGHPAFDALGWAAGSADVDRDAVLQSWAECWLLDVPGSEPLRAAQLLRSVACLRMAAEHAQFIANIEPTEHRYHAAGIPALLDAAVTAERELRRL